jgi:Putative Zn-dependent protease, contains TPR repeats
MRPNTAGSAAKRVLALLVLTISLAAAALAGPYEDANRAYRSGNYREAVRIAQAGIKQNPDETRLYVALGASKWKLGDRDGAREAWDTVIRRDPGLTSVNDDRGFLKLYREVGGKLQPGKANAPQGGSAATLGEARDILNALSTGSVYVHPDLRGEVNPADLEAAVSDARPTEVKVVVVPKLGPYPTRAAMADDLRKQLNVDNDAVVLVVTPKGISGASKRLSNRQIENAALRGGAAEAYGQGGLGAAAAAAVRSLGGAVQSDKTGDATRTGSILLVALGAVGGVLGFVTLKRKRELDEAKAPVEALRQEALKDLSYVDGYLDLLPAGSEADEARRRRAAAYERYSTATGILLQAKTAEDVRPAEPLLREAIRDLEECRKLIDLATGGTGVAMAAPELPSLATDESRARAHLKKLEEVRSAEEAARLQSEIEAIPESERGVSFFSGQPMPKSELVPVTLVIDGQKRTVMATREEAEQIRRGETPRVRAFEDNGRYVPWYDHRGYDPYRDYYRGWGYGGLTGMGTFVDLFLLSQLFGGGLFGGYGGWGGWGYGPAVIGGYPGGGYDQSGFGGGGYDPGPQYDPTPDNTGGFDFFGQGGYDETSDSGGFGFGDSGGFDFGGGDFGGGDFGGGDW